MSQLIVRRVEADIVRKLKLRAARRGRSAEAEHREILREALERRSRSGSLKALLLAMPAVGDDADFERPRDLGRRARL
jgi:antitoxin FitA